MQMLVSRYLEFSLDLLTREQEKFRSKMAQAFGMGNFGAMEDQVRRNMEMFERTFAMFTPFARERQSAEADNPQKQGGGEIDDLKKQMEEMQKRLDRFSYKDKASISSPSKTAAATGDGLMSCPGPTKKNPIRKRVGFE